MGNSFNKGEWSEFYVFLKILVERRIYGADKNLKKINDICYQILKILREEESIEKVYDISDKDVIKILYQENQEKKIEIPTDKIKSSVRKIFDKIKNTKGSSFSIPETEEVMNILEFRNIKASRKNKADINFIIHDSITNTETKVGFSIKSNIGSPPTLLNASSATNFIYKIKNLKINDYEKINSIETKSKIKDRITEIGEKKRKIIFSKVADETFEKNLRKIDSCMPIILSEFILLFFKNQGKTIKELTEKVAVSKTIKNLKLNFNKEDIKFKIKHLLLNIALGMVPKTLWDGFLKADGGYIVVKEDGEIVCFHIYSISEFAEYLFNNTILETPSSGRHDFGKIYETHEKELNINLNLQIRFM